jgi:hypothetical protein
MEKPKKPSVAYELDENIPRLKGMVTTSTGENVPGKYLIKIKNKDGWYEYFEAHSFSPDPWLIPYNAPSIVKVGDEWYDFDSESKLIIS